MVDYSALQSRAISLIQAYGTSLTLVRATLGTFTPSVGGYASSTITNYGVYGVIRSPNRVYSGDKFYEGTVIKSGDREILLAVSTDITPTVGDAIMIAGIKYNIMVSLPVEPGGTVMLYKLLCRK